MGITGIILAGGKSSRMGSDKGLILFNGKPMVSYSIELMKEFCDRIIISTSNPEYAQFGYELIPDIYPDKGPLGGLYTCLKESNSEINLCLPCDVPLMFRGILQKLTDESDSQSCIVPLTPLPEPLIAVYPSAVIPVLEQMLNEGTYKMASIYDCFPTKYINLDQFPEGTNIKQFRNMNSMSDFTNFGIPTDNNA